MIVICDTREQKPLNLAHYSSSVRDVVRAKLITGDYSVRGYEHLLSIERKDNVGELATNVAEKRFWEEMGRLQKFKYKFVLCSFDVDDILRYPIGTNIPKKMWPKLKITPGFIMYKISDIQVGYDIPVIFAGDADNAAYLAVNIMKRMVEIEK